MKKNINKRTAKATVIKGPWKALKTDRPIAPQDEVYAWSIYKILEMTRIMAIDVKLLGTVKYIDAACNSIKKSIIDAYLKNNQG